MVKQIKAIPGDMRGNLEKRERMNADIREIIEKGIENCELINTGYCDSGIYEVVEKSFYIVIEEKLGKEAVRRANVGNKLFRTYRKKGKDGMNHFYVHFDPLEWERMESGLSRS